MIIPTRQKQNHKGFTLIELLVALMVASIVLAAVATLAYALGVANDGSSDTAQKQAQVRFTTLKISELIRHCRLICTVAGGDIVIWKADDNPGNDKIDVLELAYIETGNDGDHIGILEFSSCPDWLKLWFRSRPFQIKTLQDGHDWWKIQFILWCSEDRFRLIPQCSNVQFLLDAPAPQTQSVSILFDLEENGLTRNYKINTTLRSRAENLLNSSQTGLVSDDD